MASAGFVSGPSKLSLFAKLDIFNVDAIWLTFDLKFAIMSLRRFSSLSVLPSSKDASDNDNELYPMTKGKDRRHWLYYGLFVSTRVEHNYEDIPTKKYL